MPLQKEKPLLSEYVLAGIGTLPAREQKRALRMFNRQRVKTFNAENNKKGA